MRVMCSATLVFEALAVLLAIAPGVVLTDTPAVWIVLGALVLAFAAIAVAGSLRRPSAYRAGFAVQVLVLATGFVLPAMFVVGVLFAAIWVAAYVLGRRMEADKVRWAAAAAAGPGPGHGPGPEAGPAGDVGSGTGSAAGSGTRGAAGDR